MLFYMMKRMLRDVGYPQVMMPPETFPVVRTVLTNNKLNKVDLPAPFWPKTTTREPSVNLQEASTKVGWSRPGHVKVAPSSFRMAFVVELIPSSLPGAGKSIASR